MMKDFFERGFLATVGVLSLTRERTQEAVDDMVRRGELNRDEGKQLVDKMVSRGQEERDHLRKLVREEVQNVLKEMNIATQDDVQALMARVDTLITKLEQP